MPSQRDAPVARSTATSPFPVDVPGRQLKVFIAVAILYYVLCRLALLLLSESGSVAVFWPASGLAAAAILTLGRDARWTVAAAVAVATLMANMPIRSNLPMISVFALCNALECLIFGWVMQQIDHRREHLESLRSVGAFLTATALAVAIAALPAALAIKHLAQAPDPLTEIWFTWCRSDGLGILALAPMLITLPAVLRQPPRALARIEGMLGVLLAALSAYAAFDLAYGGVLSIMTPTTLMLPVFLWLAARTPALFSSLALFVTAVVIVEVALFGTGYFGPTTMPLPERLTSAQMALVTTSAAVLTLSAMFARVNNAVAALMSSEERLGLALAAGRMYAFDHDLARGEVHRTGGLVDRLGLPKVSSRDAYLQALHPEDRPIFLAMRDHLSPAEPKVLRLLRMRASDGSEIVTEFTAQGVFDADGKTVRIRGTCVDVNELVQARAKLQSALAAGRVFAFEYDNAMRTVRRSDNAAEILGVPLETARSAGNLILKLAQAEDREALRQYGVRQPDDAFRTATFRITRPDGRIAWLEVQSTAFFDAEGRQIGLRGLARDVTESVRASQRQSMLVAELDHRVKNALARMAVVIELSREGHQSLNDYVAVIQGRIASMARTQERLSRNKWEGVGVETLISDELAAYRRGGNCTIAGPDLVLQPDTAQALAFTIHELATNAVKHGALARAEGQVSVVWSRKPQQGERPPALELAWRESCAGGIELPTRESYGLTTIRNLLRYEQGADVRVDFTPRGLHVDIVLPLPDKAQADSTEPGAAPEIRREAAPALQ